MAARGATVVVGPPSDAYVGMLAISLGAMIIGCVLLFLDWSQYPDSKAPATPQVNVPQRQAAPGGAVPGGPGGAPGAGAPGGA